MSVSSDSTITGSTPRVAGRRGTAATGHGAQLPAPRITPTDGELLALFTRHDDRQALDRLIDRHAPMVWRVCRTALRRPQDAEDAFQATFLLLVRHARSIRSSESAAGWLYRVAYRTSIRARKKLAARREESLAVDPDAPGETPFPDLIGRQTTGVLIEELMRLPAKYQTPLVLRYLEGQSRRAIADQTDATIASVQGKLARGKQMLRHRLLRRGVSLAGAMAALGLGARGAKAADTAPAHVVAGTTSNSVALASGGSLAASAAIVSLYQEGARAMLIAWLGKPAASLAAAAMVALVLLPSAPAGEHPGVQSAGLQLAIPADLAGESVAAATPILLAQADRATPESDEASATAGGASRNPVSDVPVRELDQLAPSDDSAARTKAKLQNVLAFIPGVRIEVNMQASEARASIVVPTTYVERVLRAKNGIAAGTPLPKDALNRETARIKAVVEDIAQPLLPRLALGEDEYKQVRVEFADEVVASGVEPAKPQQTTDVAGTLPGLPAVDGLIQIEPGPPANDAERLDRLIKLRDAIVETIKQRRKAAGLDGSTEAARDIDRLHEKVSAAIRSITSRQLAQDAEAFKKEFARLAPTEETLSDLAPPQPDASAAAAKDLVATGSPPANEAERLDRLIALRDRLGQVFTENAERYGVRGHKSMQSLGKLNNQVESAIAEIVGRSVAKETAAFRKEFALLAPAEATPAEPTPAKPSKKPEPDASAEKIEKAIQTAEKEVAKLTKLAQQAFKVRKVEKPNTDPYGLGGQGGIGLVENTPGPLTEALIELGNDQSNRAHRAISLAKREVERYTRQRLGGADLNDDPAALAAALQAELAKLTPRLMRLRRLSHGATTSLTQPGFAKSQQGFDAATGKLVSDNPPKVTNTYPEQDAVDVDPNTIDIIAISFDQKMSTGGYSFTGTAETGMPEIPEGKKPRWVDDRQVILPVKLEPGRSYRIGINSQSYKNFKSAVGKPAEITELRFTTAGKPAADRRPESTGKPTSRVSHRYGPGESTTGGTYTVIHKPSSLNPLGWTAIGHLSRGGRLPILLPGDKRPRPHVVYPGNGSDDWLRLNIQAEGTPRNLESFQLKRDEPRIERIGGQLVQIWYRSIPAEKPSTSPYALVIVRGIPKEKLADVKAGKLEAPSASEALERVYAASQAKPASTGGGGALRSKSPRGVGTNSARLEASLTGAPPPPARQTKSTSKPSLAAMKEAIEVKTSLTEFLNEKGRLEYVATVSNTSPEMLQDLTIDVLTEKDLAVHAVSPKHEVVSNGFRWDSVSIAPGESEAFSLELEKPNKKQLGRVSAYVIYDGKELLVDTVAAKSEVAVTSQAAGYSAPLRPQPTVEATSEPTLAYNDTIEMSVWGGETKHTLAGGVWINEKGELVFHENAKPPYENLAGVGGKTLAEAAQMVATELRKRTGDNRLRVRMMHKVFGVAGNEKAEDERKSAKPEANESASKRLLEDLKWALEDELGDIPKVRVLVNRAQKDGVPVVDVAVSMAHVADAFRERHPNKPVDRQSEPEAKREVRTDIESRAKPIIQRLLAGKEAKHRLKVWFFAENGPIPFHPGATMESKFVNKPTPRRLDYSDGKPDGKKSLGGSGHLVRFELPDGAVGVRHLRLHGSRYGTPAAPREDFEISFLSEDRSEILDIRRGAYGLFRRGDPKWTTVRFDKPVVDLPKAFWVAVDFNPGRTKGIYLSYDTSTKGERSMIGLAQQEPSEHKPVSFGGDWMVQAVLERAEAKTAVNNKDDKLAMGGGGALRSKSPRGVGISSARPGASLTGAPPPPVAGGDLKDDKLAKRMAEIINQMYDDPGDPQLTPSEAQQVFDGLGLDITKDAVAQPKLFKLMAFTMTFGAPGLTEQPRSERLLKAIELARAAVNPKEAAKSGVDPKLLPNQQATGVSIPLRLQPPTGKLQNVAKPVDQSDTSQAGIELIPRDPADNQTERLGTFGERNKTYGYSVEQLQQRLNEVVDPAPGLAVDGDYGPRTEAAVKRFQRKAGLDPTGFAGEPTRKALGFVEPGKMTAANAKPPAPQPQPTAKPDKTTKQPTPPAPQSLLDKLRATATYQSAPEGIRQEFESRLAKGVKEAKSRKIEGTDRRFVLGQIAIDDGDPIIVRTQMKVLARGFFFDLLGDPARPVGFRSHGYDPVDKDPSEDAGPITDFGVVRLTKTPDDKRLSVIATIDFGDSDTPLPAKAILKTRNGPINTPSNGYEPRSRYPKPIELLVIDGGFNAYGLSPIEYDLTFAAEGYVSQRRRIDLSKQGFDERGNPIPLDLGVIKLEAPKTVELEYVVLPYGEGGQDAPARITAEAIAGAKRVTLAPGDRWQSEPEKKSNYGWDFELRQKEGVPSLWFGYGPHALTDLGEIELASLAGSTRPATIQWNGNAKLISGHTYYLDMPSWKHRVLFKAYIYGAGEKPPSEAERLVASYEAELVAAEEMLAQSEKIKEQVESTKSKAVAKALQKLAVEKARQSYNMALKLSETSVEELIAEMTKDATTDGQVDVAQLEKDIEPIEAMGKRIEKLMEGNWWATAQRRALEIRRQKSGPPSANK